MRNVYVSVHCNVERRKHIPEPNRVDPEPNPNQMKMGVDSVSLKLVDLLLTTLPAL